MPGAHLAALMWSFFGILTLRVLRSGRRRAGCLATLSSAGPAMCYLFKSYWWRWLTPAPAAPGGEMTRAVGDSLWGRRPNGCRRCRGRIDDLRTTFAMALHGTRGCGAFM